MEIPDTVMEDVQQEAPYTYKVTEKEIITASCNPIEPEQGQVEPRLHIFGDEDTDSEPVNFHLENVTEKSAKLFAETRSAIDNRKIIIDMNNIKASLYMESLDIEDVSSTPLSGDYEK